MMKKRRALLKLRHNLDWDEETRMKKITITLTSFVAAITLGLSLSASAGTLGGCKTEAGQARYDVETDCYNSYGPTSGKWSATDRSALNVCLDSVEKQYTTDVLGCREMYMAAGDSRPIFANREGAVAAAFGLAVGIFLFLAI